MTILTRGQSTNLFANLVKHLIVDRNDTKALAQMLNGLSWDIVYDNICYSSNGARKLLNILRD